MAKKIARDNVAVSLKLPVAVHAEMTRYAKNRMLSLADFLRQAGLHEMEAAEANKYAQYQHSLQQAD